MEKSTNDDNDNCHDNHDSNDGNLDDYDEKMCTLNHTNPGKITKVQALSGQISADAQISGRAQINLGNLKTLGCTFAPCTLPLTGQ